MQKITVKLQLGDYKGNQRIFAYYPDNTPVNNIFKQLPAANYSAANKSWHLPVVKEAVKVLAEKTKEIAVLDVEKLRQR